MTPQEYAYRDLVGRIGLGFHPDTRGEDYTTLPEGLTPEAVERIVLEAVQAGLDPYEVALRVLAPAFLEGLDVSAGDAEARINDAGDWMRATGLPMGGPG